MTDRRAALYRELADLDEARVRVLRELAAAYDGAAANDERPAPTAPPEPAAPREPAGPPTDVDRARAARSLRRLGYRVRGT